MQIGLFYQIQVPKPWNAESETKRYWEMLEEVSYAEEMGMESVWFVEHHFRSEWSHSSAPDITLAAISQRTEKMRLGIAVTLVPLHHPLHVASRLATLDIVSKGRVNVGLGRSGYPYQMQPYGTDLKDVSGMLEEYLDILPGAWTQQEFSYDGQYFQIDVATGRTTGCRCLLPTANSRRCGRTFSGPWTYPNLPRATS